MIFYLALNAYGEQCVWTDNPLNPDAPIGILAKRDILPGYWEEVVKRLTEPCQHVTRVPGAYFDQLLTALDEQPSKAVTLSGRTTCQALNSENRDLLAELDQVRSELTQAQDEIERLIADKEQMRDERDVARAGGSVW